MITLTEAGDEGNTRVLLWSHEVEWLLAVIRDDLHRQRNASAGDEQAQRAARMDVRLLDVLRPKAPCMEAVTAPLHVVNMK